MLTRSAIELVRDRLTADPPIGIRLGAPRSAAGLTLFPVFSNGTHLTYQPFSHASTAKAVEVTEIGVAGSVPELTARNAGDLPVLLMEGEILIGLKQNRMLNTSVLIRPGTNVTIPVACVEAGRWRRVSEKAGASRYAVSPSIRAAKMNSLSFSVRTLGAFTPDQFVVWRGVDANLKKHMVSSPTSAYSEIEAKRHHVIEDVLGQLTPDPGQTGVLAFLGGQPLALDVFDQPATLTHAWRKLVGSYVSDALTNANQPSTADGTAALEWVKGLADGEASSHPAVGAGETVLITAKAHYLAGLVVDGVCVHIAGWPVSSAGN